MSSKILKCLGFLWRYIIKYGIILTIVKSNQISENFLKIYCKQNDIVLLIATKLGQSSNVPDKM